MNVELKDICSFQEGYVNPAQNHNEYFDGNIKWIRATDINGTYIYNTSRTLTKEGFNSAGKSAKLFEPNTLIISKSGTIGKLGILKDYMCGNRAVINIKPDLSRVNLMYLYYSIKLKLDYIKGLARGSVQKNLYVFMLEKVKIYLPDVEIQKKMIKYLEDIDKKIELNNKINNNLYELAINYLNEKVEETEVPVSKFSKIQGGYAFKSKDLIDVHTKNRIIKIKNLRSEINADVINSQFVENEVVEKLDNKFRLSKGDVAIAMTGAELGKTGFIYGNDNYFLNQRVGVIRGNNKASELYLKILFLSDEFQTLLNSKGYGSAQPNVSTSDIENILINDITEDNLKKLYEIIKPIYEKIISNSEEILNLEQLRDTLLPKMMNGEIDLDNIEI